MALTDPQSITIGATTYSLPRTNSVGRLAEYTDVTGLAKLSANHAVGKRVRDNLRVDLTKIAADPFEPATNDQFSMSAYIVIDTPRVGFTQTEKLDVVKGLTNLYSASTYALMTKLLGGES